LLLSLGAEAQRQAEAPRAVTRVELADDDRIARLYSVVATRKLSAVRFGAT
jgi:hypothetical protein